MIAQGLGVVDARVLRSEIAVVHERDIRAGLAQPQRHPQRVEHQRGAHVPRQLPAYDHPAEHVDDEREEQQALPAAQMREIGNPKGVRPLRGEVTLHQAWLIEMAFTGSTRQPEAAIERAPTR
jgi:hypothetical protein